MPREKKPPRWIDLMVQNVGRLRTGRVLSFIATWAITEPTEGDVLRIEDYGRQWKISRATAYRDLALFRQALPMFDDPSGFIALADGVDALGRVPAELLPQM